jgi:hypothetical protein
VEKADSIKAAMCVSWSSHWTPEQKEMVQKAASVGLVSWSSMTQFHLTEEGVEMFNAVAVHA